MNTTIWIVDTYQEAVTKHIVIVFLALIVNAINGMLVVTFFSIRMFSRDSRYILYIHLVINDMLMICVSVVIYVLTYAAPVAYASLCYILITLSKVFFMITPLNLAGMAIERFIAICKPLHHSQICTPQKAYLFICLLWGLGATHSLVNIIISLLTQPISFFSSFVPCYPTYMFPSKAHDEHNTALQTIYMSSVWIIISYTYCRVLFAARKAVSNKGSANKALSTILLHGVQLLLCMLSYVTPFMYTMIIPYFPLQRTNIAFCVYVLTNMMPRLLSPLIYGVRDQKFVKQMKEIFTCKIIIVKIVPS